MIPILALVLVPLAVFWLAYWTYGRYISHTLVESNDANVTPAHEFRDGKDFLPTRKPVLLGHHFASIAGAAPIVGPIVAAAAFGWLPALLWIVIANPLMGAVHDYISTMSSVRHKGRSMGGVFQQYVGKRSSVNFLVFAIFLVILVIAVFGVIVATVFSTVPEAATASLLFVVLALALGFYLYRMNGSVLVGTLVALPLLAGAIWIGSSFPIVLGMEVWLPLVLLYALVASVLPVWTLLQPRDYLSSFLLYAGLGGVIVGILVGGFLLGGADQVNMPAYTNFMGNGYGPLFPLLFITIACGAISGGHCLIACGTTSKQMSHESHGRLVGYGGMLLEGVVGVVAIATIAVVGWQGALTADGLAFALPNFALGGAIFLNHLGVPSALGATLMALLLSVFLLTTMDTLTRLGRYLLLEILPLPAAATVPGGTSRAPSARFPVILGASVAVLIPAYFLTFGAWNTLWPLFGAANQLLAALALLGATAWLAKWHAKKQLWSTGLPAVFIFGVTMAGFAYLIYVNLTAEVVGPSQIVQASIAVILMVLAVVMGRDTIRSVRGARSVGEAARGPMQEILPPPGPAPARARAEPGGGPTPIPAVRRRRVAARPATRTLRSRMD